MEKKKDKSYARGAAAAKRNAVENLASALGKDVKHSRSPNADFELLLNEIPKKFQDKALKWYELGIRRGMKVATDMVADGRITFDGENVYAPSKISVAVRTKFLDEESVKRKFEIKAVDIGFE